MNINRMFIISERYLKKKDKSAIHQLLKNIFRESLHGIFLFRVNVLPELKQLVYEEIIWVSSSFSSKA